MNTNKLLRYLIIAVIVLIVFAVIGKKAGWFGKAVTYDVATEKVAKRNITEFITANGKIQPETEVKISPEISGEIVELIINDGDEVKEGQLLLRIKPDIYVSSLERAEAAVNGAKANLSNSKAQLTQVNAQYEQAKLSYNRSKKLWEEGAISEADWETAQSSFEIAKANVESASQAVAGAEFQVSSAVASLKEARERLTKTSIFAPMSGTIAALYVEKGQRVAGTDLMAGSDLLTIADLDKMELLVEVNENDIVRVKQNDTATIEVDAYLDRKFKGIVTEIANSAKSTQGMTSDQVTNFEVKILLLKSSYQDLLDKGNKKPFLPGMSASADIMTETKQDILTLPVEAVTTRVDSISADTSKNITNEPKEVVFLFKDGKAIQQEVKTGIQDLTYIEITEGLNENDEVIVAPFDIVSKKLKNETVVNKVKKEDLFKKKK